MELYQDKYCYYIRKDHTLASSVGKEKSVVSLFQEPGELESLLQKSSDFVYCKQYIDLNQKEIVQNPKELIVSLTKQFTLEQEFGLLNRLDNATGGFLYFAKNPEIYRWYKESQQQGAIQKIYLAEVQGNPFYKSQDTQIIITTPIMHHISQPEKMIVLQKPEDQKQGRGKIHNVQTKIELIHYDIQTNRSRLKITITKGIRHQIRCHLASSGSPIIGDSLYNKNKSDFLHLRSLGRTIQQ